MRPAPAFAPPYVAVVFVSTLLHGDEDAYAQTSDVMVEMAQAQPGYLGHDSARGADGLGITVSYWTDEAAVVAWKGVGAHRAAQAAGQRRWYLAYTIHVARVERSYELSSAAVARERPAEA